MKSRDKIIETLSSCSDIDDPDEYYDELVDFSKKSRKDDDFRFMLNILNALGNMDRLLILHALKKKDRCVCELEAILNKTQPAVSHHLKILEKANLIHGWKKGKFTHYSLINQTFRSFNKMWTEWNDEATNWFSTIFKVDSR